MCRELWHKLASVNVVSGKLCDLWPEKRKKKGNGRCAPTEVPATEQVDMKADCATLTALPLHKLAIACCTSVASLPQMAVKLEGESCVLTALRRQAGGVSARIVEVRKARRGIIIEVFIAEGCVESRDYSLARGLVDFGPRGRKVGGCASSERSTDGKYRRRQGLRERQKRKVWVCPTSDCEEKLQKVLAPVGVSASE